MEILPLNHHDSVDFTSVYKPVVVHEMRSRHTLTPCTPTMSRLVLLQIATQLLCMYGIIREWCWQGVRGPSTESFRYILLRTTASGPSANCGLQRLDFKNNPVAAVKYSASMLSSTLVWKSCSHLNRRPDSSNRFGMYTEGVPKNRGFVLWQWLRLQPLHCTRFLSLLMFWLCTSRLQSCELFSRSELWNGATISTGWDHSMTPLTRHPSGRETS